MSALAKGRMHRVLVGMWAAMIPVAIVTGWLWSVAFVAACSIYANAAAHWSAAEASYADHNSPDA